MTDSCAVLVNREQEAHRLAGHPERPQRVEAILEAISRAELGIEPRQADPAPAELIAQAHDPAYVAMLDRAASSGGGHLDPDTYVTLDSMAAARTAAGAVVDGVTKLTCDAPLPKEGFVFDVDSVISATWSSSSRLGEKSPAFVRMKLS